MCDGTQTPVSCLKVRYDIHPSTTHTFCFHFSGILRILGWITSWPYFLADTVFWLYLSASDLLTNPIKITLQAVKEERRCTYTVSCSVWDASTQLQMCEAPQHVKEKTHSALHLTMNNIYSCISGTSFKNFFFTHVRLARLIPIFKLDTVFGHHWGATVAIPDPFSSTIMMDTNWQQRSAM